MLESERKILTQESNEKKEKIITKKIDGEVERLRENQGERCAVVGKKRKTQI